MKNNKINELLRPYENKWVALSSNRKKVLSSGRTLESVREQLDIKKRKEAIFLKVLPFNVNYAPFFYEVQV